MNLLKDPTALVEPADDCSHLSVVVSWVSAFWDGFRGAQSDWSRTAQAGPGLGNYRRVVSRALPSLFSF